MSKKTYNNDSHYFTDWTTKKLKEEAIGYNHAVNIVECYGMSDVAALQGILSELNKRKIQINNEISFSN